MRLLILLAIVSLFVACKTTKNTEESTPTVSSDNTQLTPDDVVIKMKKGACFGSCPVYDLRIYNNRYVEYVGKRHTNKIGGHGKTLSKDAYKQLLKAFDDSDFFTFDEFYPSDIPDLPTCKITYQKGDLTKTIAGKRERPEAIHKLQHQLELIAESKDGWTVTDLETEAEPKFNRSKVIITIVQANQLPRWFSKMRQEYSVQILESLSDSNNKWLISYDTKDYTPAQFMEILNNDPMVGSAEFQQVE